MTELRLTFASEGFAAVSQVLVAMGLSFRVEPVTSAAKKEEATTKSEATQPARRRAPAKSPRKSASKAKPASRPENPPAGESAAQGAERLRAAIARTGTGYRSPLEPPGSAPEPTPPSGEGGEPTGGNGE